MAFSNGYTIGFAAAICIVCSIAVATVSEALRETQQTNERRDLQKNILGAVGLPEDGSVLKGEQIDTLWEQSIQLVVVDDEGAVQAELTQVELDAEISAAAAEGREPTLHAVYQRRDGDRIVSYALPMDGKGLWGPITGYLALEDDGSTVMGATFFAPKETPGLGFEITTDDFKAQFVDKKVTDKGKTRAIDVEKGKPSSYCEDPSNFCVDGISGATLTCRGVDDMLADALDTYDPFLKRVRTDAGGGK